MFDASKSRSGPAPPVSHHEESIIHAGIVELDDSWTSLIPHKDAEEGPPGPPESSGVAVETVVSDAKQDEAEDAVGVESVSVGKAQVGEHSQRIAEISTSRLREFGRAVDIPIEDVGAMTGLLGVRDMITGVKSCKTPDEIERRSMDCESQFALVDQLLVALKNGIKDLQCVLPRISRKMHVLVVASTAPARLLA